MRLAPRLRAGPRSLLLVLLVAPLVVCGAAQPGGDDQQVLDQLRRAGADLTKPRDIRHYLYFPSAATARSAADRLRASGYTVDVHASPTPKPGEDWAVVANRVMVVNAETIRTERSLMDEVARQGQGVYDGWEAAAKP
ncbi:MAG TPA: ribonuclease E inhibitor RraB [Candidatus Limnocylindria bacterium]